MLYRVEVKVLLYVVADDEKTAERVALDHYCEETEAEVEMETAYPEQMRLDQWDDCLPWGGDGRTVEQYLR